MSYAQQHGSRAMMSYVHSKQRKLALEIEDAKEWASAKANADFEKVDDWALMRRCAESQCP